VDCGASGVVEGELMSSKKPIHVLGTRLVDDDGIEHEWVEIRPGRWKLQEKKHGEESETRKWIEIQDAPEKTNS
jgi:hypothetical protein